MDLFNLMARITLDTSGYKKKLGDAQKESSSFASKLKSGLGTAASVVKTTATVATAAAGALVTGTTAIVSGLTKAADAAAQAGDTIDKQSQKVGMSAESYQKWDYVMNIAGTSMQNCTVGLKTLTNQFDAAQSGSASAIEKFNRLGLSMDDLKGKSREEVFEATVKALQSVKDETEKAALANDLFGKSGQDLIPLFNQSAEETQKLLDATEKYGMVMSDDAVKASAKYQDSLTTLQTTATAIKNNLVSQLLPGMTSVLDGLTGALTGENGAEKKIEDGVDSMMKSLDTMVPRFSNIINKVAKIAVKTAPNIIVSLANGLISRLDEITESAFNIIKTLTEGLLTHKNIRTIMTATVSIMTNMVKFLADNVDLLVDSAFLMIETLIDGLLVGDNIKKLTNASLDIVVKIATGLIDNLPELLRAAWDLCVALGDAIIHYDWLSVGRNIFNSIKDTIKGFFTGEENSSEQSPAPSYNSSSENTSSISELPRMAKGGIINGPTPIIAGEAGAEAIVPLENNTEWIHRVASHIEMSSGGENVRLLQMVLDEMRSVHQDMFNIIVTALRTNSNDFNVSEKDMIRLVQKYAFA